MLRLDATTDHCRKALTICQGIRTWKGPNTVDVHEFLQVGEFVDLEVMAIVW
jgi:hypothetical protein